MGADILWYKITEAINQYWVTIPRFLRIYNHHHYVFALAVMHDMDGHGAIVFILNRLSPEKGQLTASYTSFIASAAELILSILYCRFRFFFVPSISRTITAFRYGHRYL